MRAYVFRRGTAGLWSQEAYVKASNTQANDWFGESVALSGDGATLAVGALFEDSSATGINGTQEDDGSVYHTGAVYVFRWDTAAGWNQVSYVKAPIVKAANRFGTSAELSGNGGTLAVGVSTYYGEGGSAYLY